MGELSVAVKILTDSTSYIDKGIKKDLDIKVVSLNVILKEKNMKEVEIDNKTFYKELRQDEIPTSSQPSIDEMYHIMKSTVEQGHELLCIFLSSKMSGTYASAHIAKDMVLEKHPQGKIEIMDSESNSMQLGFAAIVAGRLAKKGRPLEDIMSVVAENIKCSRFIFLPDNLEYLIKGGRIGGAGALIGNLLRIIPILTVDRGETAVLKKVRTKPKAVTVMLDQLIQDANQYGVKEVCIHHINALEEAKELAKRIEEKLKVTTTISDIGAVIGLHVGPGAIGIVYYTEEALR